MNISRAFTFSFQDPAWTRKLSATALLLLLLPLPLVGLISLCALLGYLAELMHRALRGHPYPLPRWQHLGDKVGKGLPVLLALIAYHIPLLLLYALLYRLEPSRHYIGGGSLLLPLLLAGTWVMLVLGMIRYAQSWELQALWQFNRSWGSLQANGGLALRWLLSALAANVILLALMPLGLLLFIFVQGYLASCFGRRLRLEHSHQRAAASLPVLPTLHYSHPSAKVD